MLAMSARARPWRRAPSRPATPSSRSSAARRRSCTVTFGGRSRESLPFGPFTSILLPADGDGDALGQSRPGACRRATGVARAGCRAVRCGIHHHTSQRSSPPTFCWRASRSRHQRRCDVLRIEMPRPEQTRGMRSWRTYTRRPGRETRRMPSNARSSRSRAVLEDDRERRGACLAAALRRARRRCSPRPSGSRRCSSSACSRASRVRSWRASAALRMRASMSAIGIGHHGAHQLALITPGSSPRSANRRRQMRHSSKSR